MSKLVNPGPIEFEGVIKQAKMRNNTAKWVDFPYDLKEIYGKGNLVPVVITFDGHVKYAGSIAKMGGPHPMLLLRSDIDDQVGKTAGQKVHVRVDLDTLKREIKLSKDVKDKFRKAGVLESFEKLAFSHQREYHTWIEEAKKPETRARRVERAIEQIKAKL